jgi:hypothetical protein
MFLQVIRGRTSDAAGLQRRFEEWQETLMPGSIGFLGSTGGVAEDGTVVVSARFESEASARQNSGREEQGAWWQETSKYFEDDPTFSDYTDVVTQRAGGSDDAGFVQVISGRVKNLARAKELDKEFEDTGGRPDLIGITTGYKDDGEFTSLAYFTTEEEARAGERQEMPPEMKAGMEEWMSLMETPTYVDLKQPWMVSR